MKRIFLFVLVLIFVECLNGQSPSFKTYTNPVIPGDHPDCTLSKIGNDFYTTGSSFNPTPVIYHSTDMVHWEAIAQPVSASWSGYDDKPGGGCWGGHIVYYNGEYWDFFGRANVMYYVKANDPKGPWSTPTKVSNPSKLSYGLGEDNSIFIDNDNKWYLLVKNGQANNAIVELGNDGQPTGVIYNLKWLNPSPYKYSWAEGPVMWRYDGYYYYSFALNTAGGQKVMKSKTLTADSTSWEFLGDFFSNKDPLKVGTLFTGPNHVSPAVMIEDSTSWVTHPVYMKDDWKGQGRQGLLNQVRYDSTGKPVADYPNFQSLTAPKLPSSGIPWMVPKSDFFTSDKLNPEWSFLGYTPDSKYSLTERPGWLRLSPKSSTKANTVIKNDAEHNYSLITRLDFNAKSISDSAGLWIMRGDEKMSVKLVSTVKTDGKKTISFSYNGTNYDAENIIGDTLWLKITRTNHIISGYYSSNGYNWSQVGSNFIITLIDSYTDNSFAVWEGTRQGLYVKGKDAYFDLYVYRDAYAPILAECPANQFGTGRSSLNQGIRVLNNIHQNDWALYAGIEFGYCDYGIITDSVEFTAASATSGGNIEVWLDSIDTGKKVANCTITSTGSINKFQTFQSPILSVTGNHDVYLKFTGTGTDELFQLKWINFTYKLVGTNSVRTIEKTKKIQIFPNPAKNRISIYSEFPFETIEIFDTNGNSVMKKNYDKALENSVLYINLKKGNYLVKLSNKELYTSSKLIID